MKQKRSNKTRKNSQKTRKVKIKRRQQGRKKNKKNKRKIERESDKERWKTPRKTKGRHKGETLRMNPNNPFSGGKNSVFLRRPQKPPKNRKGRRPTAQKHTCNAALPPIPRRMRTKEKNTQRKRRGCEEDHLRFSKTGSKKKRKRRKNPPHHSGKAIFDRDPKSTEKTTPPRTPRAPNLRAQRTHCKKYAFQNELSSAAPGVFRAWKPNFDKISNMEP